MNPAAAGEARREGAASPAERNPARTVATVIAIVGALTGPVSFLSFPGFGAKALLLKRGRLALTVDKSKVITLEWRDVEG